MTGIGASEEAVVRFEKAKTDFSTNLKSVHGLVNFDHDVMDFAISQVSSLHDKLTALHASPTLNGEHTLIALRNVRTNDSLRRKYSVIANQGLVLLVSYFGSAVSDIFRAAIPRAHALRVSDKLRKEDLKLSLDELVQYSYEPDSLGELFESKKDISFQDMQSIVRAFSEYIDVELARDVAVNNIIVAQACRHVIVHSGGVVDRRCMKQLASATPRTLKSDIRLGDTVQFDTDELTTVGAEMQAVVNHLADTVAMRLASAFAAPASGHQTT